MADRGAEASPDVRNDAHGVAGFESLGPGSDRVVVKAPGQAIESQIDVESGGTTSLQVSIAAE